MPKRLSEQYAAGDAVEILFEQAGWSEWLRGAVVGFQPPGLWVRLPNGSLWFVTNTCLLYTSVPDNGGGQAGIRRRPEQWAVGKGLGQIA